MVFMKHKQNIGTTVKNMHWSAKLIIKFGSMASSCLLFISFFFPKGSPTAICLGQSATYAFSVAMIGGLMLDVVAERMGVRKE